MFETRSDAWEKVGLSFEVNEREVKKAQWRAVVFLIGLIAVNIASHILLNQSHDKSGCTTAPRCQQVSLLYNWGVADLEPVVRVLAVILVLALGWGLARSVGRFVGPTFMRRMDPATAGTFGFLIRLITMGIALILALSVAGASLQSLAVGGAFTAVIVGLAAQQTLGNVIAGMVLLSARPFRVGRAGPAPGGRGRRSGGGDRSARSGCSTPTLTARRRAGDDPQQRVLAAAVVPLREPDAVDVKVRLTSGVRPSQVQAILDQEISTPTRSGASVLLEEVDGDDVVVRVQATPEMPDEGAKLADEIMVALSSVTGEHEAVANNSR